MLRSDLCDFSDAYIIMKGTITVADPDNDAYKKNQLLKIIHCLFLAFQKSIIHSLIMQKICIL